MTMKSSEILLVKNRRLDHYEPPGEENVGEDSFPQRLPRSTLAPTSFPSTLSPTLPPSTMSPPNTPPVFNLTCDGEMYFCEVMPPGNTLPPNPLVTPVEPQIPIPSSTGFLAVAGYIAALPLLFFVFLSILKFPSLFLHRNGRSFSEVWKHLPAVAALPRLDHFLYTMLAAMASFLMLIATTALDFQENVLYAFMLGVPITVSVIQVYVMWKRYREMQHFSNGELEANTIYEDFTVPFFQTLLLGTTQLLLIAMYVAAIYELYQGPNRPDIQESCNDTSSTTCVTTSHYVLFYCFAVFIEIGYVFGTDIWHGQEASADFWAKTFHALQRTNVWEPKPSNGSKEKLIVFYRCFYNTVASTTSLAFLLVALPLHLATEQDASQFLLDVVGVFFIIEMKNLSTPRVFTVTTEASTIRETRPDISDSQDVENRLGRI